MKKIIAVLLCVVFIVSLLPSVFATDSELTELVKFAKGALEIPEEYTEFETSKMDYAGTIAYTLMWSTPDSSERICCDILPTGEIIAYEASKKADDAEFIATAFEKEECLAIAAEWIKKVNPKYAKELDFDGEVIIYPSSTLVRVVFKRELSGIPVYGNEISVYLDKTTGDVLSMHASYDISEKIESEDGTIGEMEAEDKLFELFAPTLKYKKLSGEKRAILVYEPKSRGDMIAARDGEKFSVTYLNVDEPMAKDEATSDKLAGGSNAALNRAEISAIEEIESLLSKEEVSGIIKKMSGTVVARYNLQSVSYSKTEKADGEKFYCVTATLKGDANTYGEVVLNAETGELLSLYSYDGSLYSKKTKVSEDECRNTADKFVKNFSSKEYEKSQMTESAYPGRYVFTERVNGIEYDANYVSVFVNEKNGKVMSFSKSWEDGIEFDSPENLISDSEARESFVKAGGVLKYYIADGIEGYVVTNAEEFRLIYKLSDETPAYVDAKTGDPFDWDLKVLEKEEEYKPQTDLYEHFSAGAVIMLAANGIILSKNEKFMPDEAITRREMVYLLNMFEYGYYIEPTEENMDNIMRRAKERGIISDAETPATSHAYREEAASVIVNMLGYKKAAEIGGIYKTGFSDESAITKEYLGAVAIAKGLGIVSGGGNGKFFPRRAVTRGEFAVMLANLYSK